MGNKVLIGKPVSPSKHLGIEHRIVTEFVISYGGGMGGTRKTAYADDYAYCEERGLYDLTLINGDKVSYGAKFVVSIQEKRLVILKTDETEHYNYYEHKADKRVTRKYYVIRPCEEPEFIDNVNHETKANLLFTEEVEE